MIRGNKKMNLVFFVLSLSVCLLFLNGCDKMRHQRYRVVLKNNSDIAIVANPSWPHAKVGIYPDTSLSEQKDAWYPINPSAKAYWDTSVPWDKGIFKELPLDTLSIYILKKETYDSQNWENIRDDYMILQRYDLSIYDLQKLDYTLYYPPTEAMRDMKMWPRYGE